MASGELLGGRYRVLDLLGTGGMASVHLARDEALDRLVAVKRLPADSPEDVAERFHREARMGAALNHPNVVTIFDIVVDPPAVLIVMEYVEGRTLAEELRDGRAMPPERALAILEPLAAALDHVHSQGVVHRDVKPANVLLGGNGVVKLTDLGIARAAGHTPMTASGVMLGTVSYIAPEQTRPGTPTPAADVYALAAIAFEMLTGRRLRAGATQAELLAQASLGTPPDLDAAWPDGPPQARRVLREGLAPEPGDRPASAGALVAALRESFAPAAATAPGEATRAAPRVASAPPVRRRRGAGPAIAVLALAAVVVAVAALLLTGGEDDPQVAAERTATPEATREPEATATAAPARLDARERAVRAFYRRAARDDFAGAWALAGPGMRAAFGNSQSRFEADLGSLESIRFLELRSEGDTVFVRTVATHTDRTDRCEGTLATVRGPDGWQVEPAGLSCT